MPKTTKLIKDLEKRFTKQLKAVNKLADSLDDIEKLEKSYSELRQNYLDKQSDLNQILKSLKKIESKEEQKEIGRAANQLKQKIAADVLSESEKAKEKLLTKKLKQENLDSTHPGLGRRTIAQTHILTQTIDEIEDIFSKMGFAVEYAYEVDNAFNTFDVLNIPEDHPARDNWDTLWLEDGNLAIPHTSSMQNRILRSDEKPIRKIIIGKTFRNEATDASHEHTFTQVEGVYLDKSATMSQMIGVLLNFFENFFEQKLDYKFTPDFFPFVEPGGQLAIRFNKKKGSAGGTDIKTNFLEVLGCGMIHPKVIAAADLDPATSKGFAWGFGVERIAMIKHGIDDVRAFHSSDIDFIRQFK
jgi:phenylalanyl-tRNA synthetase alpha chain